MSDLIEVNGKRIKTNLLYLTKDNLFERPLYQELGITKAYMHKDAVPFLQHLDEQLVLENLYLVIYDAYRPIAAQHAMWNLLPDERYVAPPHRGSKHNRGTALDCSRDRRRARHPRRPRGARAPLAAVPARHVGVHG